MIWDTKPGATKWMTVEKISSSQSNTQFGLIDCTNQLIDCLIKESPFIYFLSSMTLQHTFTLTLGSAT